MSDLLRRVRALFRRRRLDAEFAEEIQLHIALVAARLRDQGIAERDAEREARKRFGNAALLRETSQDAWGWRWLTDFLQDLRYALRLFGKGPAFAAVAITTLALGIGANTAVFSVVDAVLLRPLQYRDPERLVAIWNRNLKDSGPSKLFQGYRDFETYSRNARSFEAVSAATWAVGGQLWTGHGPAREVFAMPVDASFFSTLGLQASLGRTFLPDDEKAGCSVVLSNRFWRNELGGDAGIAGRSLNLEHRSCAVRGVMPPGFVFYPAAVQMWTLLVPDFQPRRDQLAVGIFARLRPSATLAQAQSEVESIYAALHRGDRLERDLSPLVYPLQQEFTWLASRTLRATLLALTGAVTLVLLIACLNVASLLLGRSAGRARELAVRAAIGAGRRRLVRQLLSEGFFLSLIGSGFGAMLAYAAIRYFGYANPIELPPGAEVSIHWRVLIFTAALSVATTLTFALVPAWRGSQVDLVEGLKSGGRGPVRGGLKNRLPSGLIFAEVAFSAALLVAAGLLIDSVVRIGSEPLGFDPDRLFTTKVNLPAEGYREPARRVQFYRNIESIANLPGVAGAALSSGFPFSGGPNRELEIGGQPASAQRRVLESAVAPECFRVLGIPLIQGRGFSDADAPDSEPVAVVNAALAAQYFGGRPAVGRQIRMGESGAPSPWLTVVGVVGNVKRTSLYREMSWAEPAVVFRPLSQNPSRSLSLAIRTARRPDGLAEMVQRRIAEIDSGIAIQEVAAVNAWISRELAYPRFRALLFGVFAALALVLAAVGVYGVLAQFVAGRKRELALRIALGAPRGRVLWLVSRYGGAPVIAGLAVGIALSSVAGKALAGLLYGVQPSDLRILAGVSLVFLTVAGIALAVPARRATQVDPIAALREE